jgi:histidine triad (HIT) family protein
MEALMWSRRSHSVAREPFAGIQCLPSRLYSEDDLVADDVVRRQEPCLNEAEWQALMELQAGTSITDAARLLGLDVTGFRSVIAAAAEKLRIASVQGTSDAAESNRFELPDRSPCPYCENFIGHFGPHGGPAVIFEDELICAYLNPGSLGGLPGHALVVTRRHVETIFDVTDAEAAALGRAVTATAGAIHSALNPPGVLIQQHNGVAAFQTVPHVHFHVIPKMPGPFPGPEQPQMSTPDQRVQLARLLRSHLA